MVHWLVHRFSGRPQVCLQLLLNRLQLLLNRVQLLLNRLQLLLSETLMPLLQ